MVKNHYKDEKISKRLPNKTDEQVEFTGMKINKHFLITGATGAGKTNALYDYLIQTSKPKHGTFKHIFLCYKTAEPMYEELVEQLGKQGITLYKSLADFPSVNEFNDAIADDYKYNYLVVFDDCINDKDKASYKKVNDYFTYGRKKNITICYLAQSFFDADTFIRKQMSYLLLLSIKGKTDLNNILREYSLNCSQDKLLQIFDYATTPRDDDDIPFLKICCDKCPLNKKFSRDFIEYIDFESDV
jgi:hypothetical protein